MKPSIGWRWSAGIVAAVLILMGGLSLVAPRVVAQGTPASGADCAAVKPAVSPVATAEATTAAIANPTPAAATCVTIGMYDIYFDPNLVTIPANTPVTIALENKGAAVHDFSVTDHNNPKVQNLNIALTLQPGEKQSVTLKAPPGTYYFYCNQPGHEAAGMYGYLIVQENAKISAKKATVTPPAGS